MERKEYINNIKKYVNNSNNSTSSKKDFLICVNNNCDYFITLLWNYNNIESLLNNNLEDIDLSYYRNKRDMLYIRIDSILDYESMNTCVYEMLDIYNDIRQYLD